MTTPAQLRPYWRRVLDGEEPVFHDGYSGHDWAEEQRDAYWEALRQAADEIERLQDAEDRLNSYRIMDAGKGSRTAFIEQAKQAIKDAQKERDEARAEAERLREERDDLVSRLNVSTQNWNRLQQHCGALERVVEAARKLDKALGINHWGYDITEPYCQEHADLRHELAALDQEAPSDPDAVAFDRHGNPIAWKEET